jgi:molybdopterin-binding protein
MELSAHNKIKGKIREIKPRDVMAKISIEIAGGSIMSSVITVDSVEDLKLKVGDTVYAVVKSIEVMIGK